MKIILIAALLFGSFSSFATELNTIYLLRHAEKSQSDPNKRDPELSECGIKRANFLVDLFSDIKINRVFSTNYKRTQSTAAPLAKSKSLPVLNYDPRQLKEFAALLSNSQSSENIVVVGHSNTTNVVAGYLAGETLPQLAESEYDKLFQVSLNSKRFDGEKDNKKGKLQVLDLAFKCD